MSFTYKDNDDMEITKTNQMLVDSNLNDGLNHDNVDRISFFNDSLMYDLQISLESDNLDIDKISNLLDILCESINGEVEITSLINLQVCSCLINYFPYSPVVISRIFKKIPTISTVFDDFFIKMKPFLISTISESSNDDVSSNMLSIISTISARHPESMIEFVNILFTKKINIDIARFVYNIIPVAQHYIQNSEDYKKVSSLISQIIICNDLDVILVGVKILSLAIDCKDITLMKSFEKSQLLYESLLYYSEVKKIAAGYRALTITMCCLKNRIECIKNAANALRMAETQIKLIPNIIRQSIILYVCEYSRLTKSCVPNNLFSSIVKLAEDGNFFIRNDAANCIAISIIETKIKITDLSYIIIVFSSNINENKAVTLNIINALNVIYDYAVLENTMSIFNLEVLGNFNFDELLNDEDEMIHDATQVLLNKISKTM